MGIFKNQSKTCINSNVSISVNNERKLTSNIAKSKQAFPVFNESYLSLVAFTRFEVIKNQTGVLFFGTHIVLSSIVGGFRPLFLRVSEDEVINIHTMRVSDGEVINIHTMRVSDGEVIYIHTMRMREGV